jgi:hypothetical protein
MAGFKAVGGVGGVSGEGKDVVFLLKSSRGHELKTFTVPSEKADEFAESIKTDEPNLRASLGETDPLRLIRVSQCF